MSSERLFHRAGRPAELLIRGAYVLDPRAGLDEPHDVLIRAGCIAELGSPGSLPAPEGGETIEAAGKHLFPGFVDPHVHLRTPGQEYKESIDTGTAAAAAGGFCAVIAMPNTDPVVDEAPVLRSLVETARRQARVPVGFLASITRGLDGDELTEMAELRDAGALGFTDDGKPVVSAGVLRKALQYQRLCGGVISLHEEDPELSRDGAMHEGAVSARLGIAGIPSLSESTMVARDAALAAYEGARVHFQHLSCVESVQALAQAKRAGASVSGEVCPHHLTLTDDIVRTLDSRFKMNPPLRAESDRRALVEALKAGVIDCVATDHAPHAGHEKEVPFEQAPMGTTGLETAFAALFTELVMTGELALDTVIERMTAGAALYGLPVAPIAPSRLANLCLVDLDARFEVGAEGYMSRSANSCFHGRTLHGKVLLTVAAGTVAYTSRTFAEALAKTPLSGAADHLTTR
ncbi:MAG TPA: dihydroorotase [Solirubrobacteraceae bacterium]|nr:dihydroorotase [Solirubrobacteraceae bacterium]